MMQEHGSCAVGQPHPLGIRDLQKHLAENLFCFISLPFRLHTLTHGDAKGEIIAICHRPVLSSSSCFSLILLSRSPLARFPTGSRDSQVLLLHRPRWLCPWEPAGCWGGSGPDGDGTAQAPQGERHWLWRGAVGWVPLQSPQLGSPRCGGKDEGGCSASSLQSWAGKGAEQPSCWVSPVCSRMQAQTLSKIPPNLKQPLDPRFLHPSKGRCALQLLQCFGT